MALAGVRVVDLTDERGIYAGKLLADLGADVIRPEPFDGDPLRQRGPFLDATGAAKPTSLWHAFFASSRRFTQLAADATAAREQLEAYVDRAQIILLCDKTLGTELLDLEACQQRNAALVIINVSSFKPDAPWGNYQAPDLVAGALAGVAATTGDSDTPPLKGFGELNFMVSGIYAAIAALSGLAYARKTQRGQQANLYVHECLASCLEHVLMFYWYPDKLQRPEGQVLPRRGGLHWTDAYAVMPAKTGSIMVTPAPDFDTQLTWLIEEGVQEDLIDPKYMEVENLRLRVDRSMTILRSWAATKDAEELFYEAQRRHCPYGWVLPIERVADNPQLEARAWYETYQVAGQAVQSPGMPYHFSKTPWRLRDYPAQPPAQTSQTNEDGEAAAHVLNQLGWDAVEPQTAAQPSDAKAGDKPLQGLRVLDFTHVLAGPFATRILADMGADVVKINSAARMVGAQDHGHPYYIMWNRNKRALALDMRSDDAKALAEQLCQQADIVIDNFSAGVLDRWGIGYDAMSATNKKVIYVQMSGMGDTGPWSKFVTYAPTIHALGGLTHVTGVPGREDIGVGFSYNDHQAGLHGAIAVLAALETRHRTGEGQRVDISQFEVGVNFLGPALMDYFCNDVAARPCANDLPYDLAFPHACFPCKPEATNAERWIAIACMDDEQWRRLVHCIVAQTGDTEFWPALAEANITQRLEQKEALTQAITAFTETHEAYALMQILQSEGVPAGVVQDGRDLNENDPQLSATDFLDVAAEDHPVLGKVFADRLPIHFSETPCEDYERVHLVGEDNQSVLQDWLGLSGAEIEALQKQGFLE